MATFGNSAPVRISLISGVLPMRSMSCWPTAVRGRSVDTIGLLAAIILLGPFPIVPAGFTGVLRSSAIRDQMPQRARGIQQIQPSLADYEVFPKGGGSAKSFEFAA